MQAIAHATHESSFRRFELHRIGDFEGIHVLEHLALLSLEAHVREDASWMGNCNWAFCAVDTVAIKLVR